MEKSRYLILKVALPVVIAVLLVASTGCGRLEQPVDLVIVNGPEPESLDPALVTAQADGRVVASMFEGLARFNAETAGPEPGLAERWEISEDGRIYTFHLRASAQWSTGEPITAEDCAYSWLRVLEPSTGCVYSSLLFCVKNAEAFATGKLKDRAAVGLRALDPRTFLAELNDPTPFFPDICALPTLGVVPRQTIDRLGDRWILARSVPVSGAYELVYWRLNDRIRLRKNPRYWDADNTRSAVVDLLRGSTANTALNLYETGLADIVWDKELIPLELMDLLRKRPDFHSYDFLSTYFIRFNVTRKPFDDVRVRKALAMAIDKRHIVGKIMKAGEKVAEHFVPPGLPNYEPAAGLHFDAEAARRLLAEAGFPAGQNFPRFHYMYNNTGKTHEQIAVELQALWKRELGIQVELRNLDSQVYLNAQSRLDYDTCRSSWIGDYNDPNTFLDIFSSQNGNNRTGWKNPRYDQLLREANRWKEPRKRAKLLQTAEALLIREEVPIVPLYIYAGMEYYDAARIKGVSSNVRGEHPLRAIWKAAPAGQRTDRTMRE
ncbi:MAG: peptide ABC transporter substrate-binding protein [Verrucomicrobia bacterium]|nr:peptide ABC transporter substrate-binding protein [Verrucomicrobiota bacterium]